MGSIEDYDDLHRATLQTLMGNGTIKCKEFNKIFKKLCQNFLPENDQPETVAINKTIDMINEKISAFDQKIIKYNYELTNEEFFVFFSSAKTSMSKLQNSYNEAELDLFKMILTKIVENDELNIAPRDALNLSSSIPGKLNKLRAQKLLDNWIAGSYFVQHSDNKIYLGPKTLIEFKELLQSMELNYLKSCLLCESIAIWGDRCGSCDTIYHKDCIRKFLSRSEKCPSCKEKWAAPAVADNDD